METNTNIVSEIGQAINEINSKQTAILVENKVYTNAQLKAGEKDKYYKLELEKKQLMKFLAQVNNVQAAFAMYRDMKAQEVLAAEAAKKADSDAADVTTPPADVKVDVPASGTTDAAGEAVAPEGEKVEADKKANGRKSGK